MLIGGELVGAASRAEYETRSPTTGEPLARVPAANGDDVERAVAAASRGFAEWRQVPPRERAATLRAMAGVLHAHREELGRLDALDGGNPVTAMTKDVDLASEMLECFADWADQLAGTSHVSDTAHLHYTLRQPYGVVARIVPYNHPLMFAA